MSLLPSQMKTTPFTGVVQLLDYFEHQGVHGKHVCMVFETMGPNVLALIKHYNFKGIPQDIVRRVATHTLIGLDYLHRTCGIIHTDLKPENVLVTCPNGIPVGKHGALLIGPQLLEEMKQTYRAALCTSNPDGTKSPKSSTCSPTSPKLSPSKAAAAAS